MRNINLNSAQTQLLASLLPEYLKVRVVLFTPLMGWNFEDHFEDSKGPGPQGHDAIAGFFGLKTQPLHNILGKKRNLESLYSHSHTNTKMVARNLFCVEGEGARMRSCHTHLCSSRAPQMQNLNRYIKRHSTIK
jgi:hypothetical protein